MNYPQSLLGFVLDTIFPIKCLGCSELHSPSQKHPVYMCKKCFKNIPIKKQFECIGCKINISLGKTCSKCIKNNYIDQLLIATDYNHLSVIKMIKTFKYRFITDMIKPISLILKKYIFWLSLQKKYNITTDNPLIIPVPLFYRRYNWRGFNQAELLTKSLTDMLQQDYQSTILLRVKNSKPQADISGKIDRLKNPVNIFQINDPKAVKDKTVLLIDDICTTGATLNECAKVLKEAGAKKIIGFVIARG